MASGGSTVVEHSSHHPKVEGSSLASTTGTKREKGIKNLEKKVFIYFKWLEHFLTDYLIYGYITINNQLI